MELPLYTNGTAAEAEQPGVGESAPQRLGEICEYTDPVQLVAWALGRFAGSNIVTTTAFGMEGCALIDMISKAGGGVEIVYLDTHFFFKETYALRDRLAERYPNLSFVNAGTTMTPEEQAEKHGPALWNHDPDMCCHIRKVEPMREAMKGRDVWITGLRRTQSETRASLKVLQWDWQFHVLKFSPLAHWERADVWKYIKDNDVPFNELHLRDYPTIGCTHCTKPVPGSSPDQYSRDGRWAGSKKTECGLHMGEGI